MKFDWDEHKNQLNYRKHNVYFEEAVTIFNDPDIYSIPDIDHSESEERWLSLGFSEAANLLLVVHLSLTPNPEPSIRVISARKATSNESEQYRENR